MKSTFRFPNALTVRFKKFGVDVNDPKFGAWWHQPPHSRACQEYKKIWEVFLDDNPTRDAILKKGKELASEYGYKVYF